MNGLPSFGKVHGHVHTLRMGIGMQNLKLKKSEVGHPRKENLLL